jgi:hypothetical protein
MSRSCAISFGTCKESGGPALGLYGVNDHTKLFSEASENDRPVEIARTNHQARGSALHRAELCD